MTSSTWRSRVGELRQPRVRRPAAAGSAPATPRAGGGSRRRHQGVAAERPRASAPSSSCGRAFLSRKPLAPARSASKTSSSRSNVVSTSTFGGSGSPARVAARVACDAVEAGHAHVHEHDVGARARRARRAPCARRRPPPRRPCPAGTRAASGSRRAPAPGRRRGRREAVMPDHGRRPRSRRPRAARPSSVPSWSVDALAQADQTMATTVARPRARRRPSSRTTSSTASAPWRDA